MEKKQAGAIATAGVVAAILIGGAVTVALASVGAPTPVGTEQSPTILSTVTTTSSASTTSPPPAPSSTPPAAPAPAQVPAQPPAAGDNGGMTEPAPQPEPDPVPRDSNGNPLNPTNALTPPPPPPPPNGQPDPGETTP